MKITKKYLEKLIREQLAMMGGPDKGAVPDMGSVAEDPCETPEGRRDLAAGLPCGDGKTEHPNAFDQGRPRSAVAKEKVFDSIPQTDNNSMDLAILLGNKPSTARVAALWRLMVNMGWAQEL